MLGMTANDIGITAGAGAAAAQERARGSIDTWSADQLKASKRIYTYYFDRVIPWPEHPEFGAFHTSDVPYAFNTIHAINRPWEAVDDTVADAMSSYWTNFAKTGDPNGGSLPRWPAYSPADHQTMQLGARLGPMPVVTRAQRP